MRVVAIPIKSLSLAKTRLASLLSPMERAALTLAMLEDELDAALAVPGWETWVVSPEETVLEIGARRGARAVAEAKPPLSAAVRQVEQEALRRGASALAVLLGDVPLLSARALTRALRTLGPVVAAPSESAGGTNLLLRRPPRAIPARFGRQSFRKHQEAARTEGLPIAVIEDEAITFDLDVPADVEPFLAADKPGRTREVCLEMRLLERLAAPA